MDTNKLEERLGALLPDQLSLQNMDAYNKNEAIAKEAQSIKAGAEMKKLTKIKCAAKQKLRREEAKLAKAESLGLTAGDINGNETEAQMRKIAEQKKQIETIEAIEAETVEPLDIKSVAAKSNINKDKLNEVLKLQGASRPEMAKLLANLNINLSVQLTKTDTANLLACLLTCNESQLRALMNNKKIPVVIKTVIKRLLEDTKLGNMDTVEKLWDRVFGKGPMQMSLPESQQLQTGILPNMPISREAYIVIRENLMK